MESTFPAVMDSNDRANRGEMGVSPMVQYARYPPALESSLRSASSLGSARSQAEANKSPPLHRKETPRGIRSAIPISAARSGPSMSPPAFDAMRHPVLKDNDQAESRILPSRDITDDTIDDAYVMFILYCNPNVPSSVDTSELRKTFRCPPRSDGKSFSVFTLFELIRKLDSKELKTWIQLAIELGVEPPSMEKKQSTQKVQQYAVRLKRWMRAMHVDAFFEFCLGHPHPYFTQLPPSGAFISESRDGVPLEEDLALRALVPEWKPKRGRKRADERDLEEDRSVKRPSLDTSVGGLHQGSFANHSVTFPQSAIPFSAFPEDDPWMTATSSYPPPSNSEHQGQDLRWRIHDREHSPAYPQSAIIPRSHPPTDVLMSAEPRSAITPSSGERARSKRKHGPAVSSAWPSSNGLVHGKSRGRPPNKPSSGSFNTFQVQPTRDPSLVPPNPTTQSSPLVVDSEAAVHVVSSSSYDQSPTPAHQGRPGKLQLQVPQHLGAPVRLATPPTVLVNGVNEVMVSHGPNDQDNRQLNSLNRSNRQGSSALPAIAGPVAKISMDDIIRAVSAELMRAGLIGRSTPLTSDEAHVLASGLVANLSPMYFQLPLDFSSVLLAYQLGVSHHFGLGPARLTSIVIRFDDSMDVTGGRSRTPRPNEHNDTGPRYNVTFEYRSSGPFCMQITLGDLEPTTSNSVPPSKNNHDDNLGDLDSNEGDSDHPTSEASWKQRYLKLKAQMQKKERAISNYKRKIVESVMADI
ncbi:ARS binding protein 2 [Penicillium chermesinum]|nr:ARS binding protein 2 [Penicillium chermesinum]